MENKAFNIFDFKSYAENCLVIRNKNAELVPFIFNKAQTRLNDLIEHLRAEKKPIRIIILKARQMGFSTYVEGRILYNAVTNKNFKCGIITHREDATTNLFNMSKRYYDNLPDALKPTIKASNAKELIFNNKMGTGLDSNIKCMTASSDGVGRSDTYNALHASELAFWEGDVKSTMIGLTQAVPTTPNSMIIIESTANGFNIFKDLWDKANASGDEWNGYYPIFFPWYEEPSYRRKYDGFPLTKEEIALKVRFNLDNEQLAWRRYAINNLCLGDIDLFHQEYPISPEEAFISTGRTVFDKTTIVHRIDDIKNKTYEKMYFDYDLDGLEMSNIKPIFTNDNVKSIIKVYERPNKLCPYVIGVDTAGEGIDYSVAQVLDNTTGKQVAVMRAQTDEDYFTYQLFCLGLYYNNALIGIESNLTTYPIKKLNELGYDNQYIREREDNMTGKLTQSYGFRTTTATKPIIISTYKRMFREDPELIIDLETLKEMLTFVEKPSNTGIKVEALEGYHDDCVMSLAIAYYLFTGDQQEHEYSINQIHEENKVYFLDEDDDMSIGKETYLKWD